MTCPCKGSKYITNIWTASAFGQLDRVSHLIDAHGARPDKEDEYKHTPLFEAARCGQTTVCDFLISRGADVNHNACGATALHRASYAGHGEVVKRLLCAGAETDARDKSTGDLRTALHKAASQGHDQIVKLLLAAGCNSSVVDARGKTASMVARECGHDAIASLIEATAGTTTVTTGDSDVLTADVPRSAAESGGHNNGLGAQSGVLSAVGGSGACSSSGGSGVPVPRSPEAIADHWHAFTGAGAETAKRT